MDGVGGQRSFSTALSDIAEVTSHFSHLHNQTNHMQKTYEWQQEPQNTGFYSTTVVTELSPQTPPFTSSVYREPFGHLVREILKLTEQSTNYPHEPASQLDPSKFDPSTMEVPIVYKA